MASGAQLSADASTTPPSTNLLGGPYLDTGTGMDTSSPSKRRMGGDATTEAASPGPKRLAQHRTGPDPARGAAATLDELTFEVRKLHEQGTHDADYFKQIYNVTEDHGARITIAHKFMKSESAQLKSEIALNATMVTDNDTNMKKGLALLEAQVVSNTKVKEGLALLEAQVLSNSTAIAELRRDVQGAVHGISQQVGATPTSTPMTPLYPEMQSLRIQIEEHVRTKREGIYLKFTNQNNDILQRTQAMVASLRIDEVHRHLLNLDSTLSQTAAQLGSRSDEFDRRIAGIDQRLNLLGGPTGTTHLGPNGVTQRIDTNNGLLGGPTGATHSEPPSQYNFPRPGADASPTPSFTQTYPNLGGPRQDSPLLGQNYQQTPPDVQSNFQTRIDRRPIFDDKIASSDMMKYTDAKKNE